jgi:hypothetical protein
MGPFLLHPLHPMGQHLSASSSFRAVAQKDVMDLEGMVEPH